jgi:signal peptide peptidase SppA
LNGQVWSFGVYSELTSWLSLSAGIDGFNQPELLGAQIKPDFVFGASVRPILGEPWISFGSEVRIAAGARPSYDVFVNRAIIDINPYEGVHVWSAYARAVDLLPQGSVLAVRESHQLWFGLSLSLGGFETTAAAMAMTDAGREQDVFGDSYLALTLELDAEESLVRPGGRYVDLVLSDDLRAQRGMLDPGTPVTPLVFQLDRIADDETVGTVLLTVGKLEVGLATVDELRAAIKRVRENGKRVIATLSTADDKSFMVAAACDSVRMDPTATLVVDGFSVALRHFAEGLGKIGVRFEAIAVGQYKTGPDQLTEPRARPEERETQQQLLAEAYRTLKSALTEDRGLTEPEAEDVISRGMFTATEALELRLVDELTTSTDPDQMPNGMLRGDDLREPPPSRRWAPLPTVAVVPVVGAIAMKASDNPLPGPTAEVGEVLERIEAVANDGDVAAVVLRVDSPGGDVLASDLIWRAVKVLATMKPVVVSMGDVAASGGYWISMPAHKVFAEANTVTGSIGIFALKADLSGLFDLLGIRVDIEKQGAHADWDDYSHPISDEDRARAERNLRAYYDMFVSKVASGRKLPEAEVRKLAEGKVYTGRAALALGLVDQIGGLADAIREAKTLAGYSADDDVKVDLPSFKPTAVRLLRNMANVTSSLGSAGSDESPISAVWQDLMRRVKAYDGRILALMPLYYDVTP